jgi:hypothetical protein
MCCNPKLLLVFVLLLVGCGGSASPNGGVGYVDPDATGADGAISQDAAPTDGGKADSGGQADTAATDAVGLAGKGEVGDPCIEDSDCKSIPGGECFLKIDPQPAFGFPGMSWPGGYCSKACTAEDQDCGDSGSCNQSGSGGGSSSWKMEYCTKPCKADTECRTAEGYTCKIVLLNFGYCGI